MLVSVLSVGAQNQQTEPPAQIQGERPQDVQLVFLGDSITDNYRKASPPHQNFNPIFKEFYGAFHPVNFAKSGYTSAQVAKIIESGILDHLAPKLVYLLVGTNDTHFGVSVEDTVKGIQNLETLIHKKFPHAHLLIIGILPSDAYNWNRPGSKDPAAKWKADREVNRRIAAFYRRNPKVTTLDVGKVLLTPAGKVNASLYYDPKEVKHNGKFSGPLHPDTVGQRKVAAAIQPTLLKLMKKK